MQSPRWECLGAKDKMKKVVADTDHLCYHNGTSWGSSYRVSTKWDGVGTRALEIFMLTTPIIAVTRMWKVLVKPGRGVSDAGHLLSCRSDAFGGFRHEILASCGCCCCQCHISPAATIITKANHAESIKQIPKQTAAGEVLLFRARYPGLHLDTCKVRM